MDRLKKQLSTARSKRMATQRQCQFLRISMDTKVVNAYIKKITEGPKIESGDKDALTTLRNHLCTSLKALQNDKKYRCEINASSNIIEGSTEFCSNSRKAIPRSISTKDVTLSAQAMYERKLFLFFERFRPSFSHYSWQTIHYASWRGCKRHVASETFSRNSSVDQEDL